MPITANFFDSRDLFFNQLPLKDLPTANVIIRQTDDQGRCYALLNLASALVTYNSSWRLMTQKIVALDLGRYALGHIFNLWITEEKNQDLGLFYSIFLLSGYQHIGEALIIALDLLDHMWQFNPAASYGYNLKITADILYGITYLGLYLTPQGHSLMSILKISKVAYFSLNQYFVCSDTYENIQNVVQYKSLNCFINFLASLVHLFGSSLQLYAQGTKLLT